MSHSSGYRASGKLGPFPGTRLGQAIPIVPSYITAPPAYLDDCPSGFHRVFGVCQMDAPTGVMYTTPFALAGKR